MKRYSVSIVYECHIGKDQHLSLKVLILNANNDDEALGKAIRINDMGSKSKGWKISMKVILEIEDEK